jgi:hypothetical protein
MKLFVDRELWLTVSYMKLCADRELNCVLKLVT